ncbi:MAG: TRAP transporter small permease [Rhodobacteraceae bacterium]|nr:TRAP transporter small permease [Paracoccaceae bacterium]MCY4248893.1 TRAP transporter small permease [Paracoccaceae bacterium]
MELTDLVKIYGNILTRILALFRVLAIIALGLMVACILIQVFFRYILNNALPWPDEAARFCMLWMTGLMAPSAYRWGSFVSIDIIKDFMGRTLGGLFNLLILVLGIVTLLVALWFANKHIASGWLFNSSSMKIPLSLIGMESIRIKLAWMYMSLPTGFILMVLVGLELIIQQVHTLLNSNVSYPSPYDKISSATE